MLSAWVVGRYVEKLDRDDIESYINETYTVAGQRERELLEGYRVALDPRSWLETWKLAEEKENKEKRMKRARVAKRVKRVPAERGAEAKVESEMQVEGRRVSINLGRESEDNTLSRKRERNNSVSASPKAEPAAEIGVGIDPITLGEHSQTPTKQAKCEVTMEDLVKTDGIADDDSRDQGEVRSSPITTTAGAANLLPSKIPSTPEAFDAWFWRHQLQRAFCSSDLLKDEVFV